MKDRGDRRHQRERNIKRWERDGCDWCEIANLDHAIDALNKEPK